MGYTYTTRKLENSKKGGGCKRGEWEMVDYGEGRGRRRVKYGNLALSSKGDGCTVIFVPERKGPTRKKKTLNAE